MARARGRRDGGAREAGVGNDRRRRLTLRYGRTTTRVRARLAASGPLGSGAGPIRSHGDAGGAMRRLGVRDRVGRGAVLPPRPVKAVVVRGNAAASAVASRTAAARRRLECRSAG